jgi:hypothetical protein
MTTPEPLATIDAGALADLRRQAGEPDELRRALASRLNVPADTPPAAIMAALDQAMENRPFAGPPAGSELLDSESLAELREDAERGRTAHHRDIVSAAIRLGKIPPASRASWITLLQTDPNAERTLAGLKRGTIPLAEIGHAGDPERDLYHELFRD